MRSWLVVLVALAGCDYVWKLDQWPDAGQPPLVDSDLQMVDAGPCEGTIVGAQSAPATGLFSLCVPGNAVGVFTIASGFDTSVDCDVTTTPPGTLTELCVKYAHTISMQAPANINGSRPLVLVGIDAVLITNNLDVSGRFASVGPGSDYPGCDGTPGGAGNKGGGGGGGGSFATKGGDGGTGKGLPGAAGTPVSAIDRIRGGCAGTQGGDGPANGTGGSGGHSGGAVYLLSNGTIQVSANINASGGGGGGGHQSMTVGVGGGGGGGGGSGGMIVIDAPTIMINQLTAHLVANGAGGGGAGGATANGTVGGASLGSVVNVAPSGGPGGDSLGGDGGSGSALGTTGGPGIAAPAGGGGGGGEGYILFYTSGVAPMLPTTVASPAPYINNGH